MHKISLILFVALLGFASAAIENKVCFYTVNETSIYNLFNFSTLLPQTIPIDEGFYDLELTFHLCNRQVPVCGNKTQVFTYGKVTSDDDQGFCQNLTSADMTSPVPSFRDQNDADGGLVLTFPTYNNGTNNVTFVVNLLCDDNVTSDQIQWSGSWYGDTTNRVYTITGSGKQGCPATLAKFLEFYNKYYFLFAIAFIVIGLLSLVGGIKFFNITIFVLTTVLVGSLCIAIIFELTTVQTTMTTKWIIFVICLILGMGAGYAAIKVEKIGFFALGALLGALGSLFLYSTLLHFLDLSDILLYVVISFVSIIGGVLGVWLWKDIIILGTSCIGSYLIVRGVSLFVGGFPNEIEVAEGTAVFDYRAYAYLAAMVLIAIGGIVYQWKHGKKPAELEDEYHQESLIREEY